MAHSGTLRRTGNGGTRVARLYPSTVLRLPIAPQLMEQQHTPPGSDPGVSPGSRARVVFDRAVEIESPADRQAYLARTCGDDLPLRRIVDALLRAYEQA